MYLEELLIRVRHEVQAHNCNSDGQGMHRRHGKGLVCNGRSALQCRGARINA